MREKQVERVYEKGKVMVNKEKEREIHELLVVRYGSSDYRS